MRAEGMRRITDRRVQWSARLPETGEGFDRILCGSALWQLEPIPETLRTLAGLLVPRGVLSFNIPALYLREPDDPGGGSDPYLLSLPALLSAMSDGSSVGATPEQRLGCELHATRSTPGCAQPVCARGRGRSVCG
jgi:hypothetical protein